MANSHPQSDTSPIVVILANGQPPAKTLLQAHLQVADLFVCADGGANAAAALGVTPDFIIGDLDSISTATTKEFAEVTTRRIADQYSTDLEKALTWVTRKGYTDVRIFGATGGRLDHTVGNLSALAKFSRKARIRMYDADGELSYVGSEITIDLPVGLTISLLPLTLCEGVSTKGLKWNLKYESLALGSREGTSNVVTASPVTIKVRRGTLLLFQVTRVAAKTEER